MFSLHLPATCPGRVDVEAWGRGRPAGQPLPGQARPDGDTQQLGGTSHWPWAVPLPRPNPCQRKPTFHGVSWLASRSTASGSSHKISGMTELLTRREPDLGSPVSVPFKPPRTHLPSAPFGFRVLPMAALPFSCLPPSSQPRQPKVVCRPSGHSLTPLTFLSQWVTENGRDNCQRTQSHPAGLPNSLSQCSKWQDLAFPKQACIVIKYCLCFPLDAPQSHIASFCL